MAADSGEVSVRIITGAVSERPVKVLYAVVEAEDGAVHVMPLHGRPHLTSDCWCHPQPDPIEPEVVIHEVPH